MTQQPVPHQAWVFVTPEHLPEVWRDRAVPVFLVPLLPHEAERLLGGEEAMPPTDPDEAMLLSLVAQGYSIRRMAREFGISTRGIQHRLARLRRRFKVASTSELAAALARRGFGDGTDAKRGEEDLSHG